MILAILQARCSSRRLPGKVLAPVLGEPMLARQIERIRHAERIDQLLVATSEDPSDDPLEDLCQELNVDCYRGSLPDVLDRFYQAAQNRDAQHIVRLTGDCPLTDPGLIDDIITAYLRGNFDYYGNTIQRFYPDGLDVEVLPMHMLERAWRETTLPWHREHVTTWFRDDPDLFKTGSFTADEDHSLLRWTVDEPNDLAFVRSVYERLYPSRPTFNRHDILQLLAGHPEIAAINAPATTP